MITLKEWLEAYLSQISIYDLYVIDEFVQELRTMPFDEPITYKALDYINRETTERINTSDY